MDHVGHLGWGGDALGQVRHRGFAGPDAYIAYLILDDEDRQEARQLAMEAFASGPGRFDREFLDALQAYIEASNHLEQVGGLPTCEA